MRLLELIEEARLARPGGEDVDLVRVQGNPLVDGAVAVIAQFQNPAAAQPALDAEVPRLRVRLFDVVGKPAEAPGAEGEVRKGRARLIDRLA